MIHNKDHTVCLRQIIWKSVPGYFKRTAKTERMEITPFYLPNYVNFRLGAQKAVKWLQIASFRNPAKIRAAADQRMKPFCFSKHHTKRKLYTPSRTNNYLRAGFLLSDISDHLPVFSICPNSDNEPMKSCSEAVFVRNKSSANMDKFLENLQNVN